MEKTWLDNYSLIPYPDQWLSVEQMISINEHVALWREGQIDWLFLLQQLRCLVNADWQYDLILSNIKAGYGSETAESERTS